MFVTGAPKGGRGRLMFFALFEISGLPFEYFPVFSLVLLTNPVALYVLSFVVVASCQFSRLLSSEILMYCSLRDGLFSMALAKQRGDDSW